MRRLRWSRRTVDEAVAIVAANDRIGEVHVFDHGLQLAAMELGHFAAEDGGDLVWLADGAIGVQEALLEFVESGAAMEHQVVTELSLGEEQPMPTTGLIALLRAKNGVKQASHFWPQATGRAASTRRPIPAGAPAWRSA